MGTVTGTFTVEDSFCITGRGLVLAGIASGQVATGHWLLFDNGSEWRIGGVNFILQRTHLEKWGLLVDAPLATHEELVQRGIIGAVAQIVAL